MHTPEVIWRIEIYDETTGLLYSSCTNNDIDEHVPDLAQTLEQNKQSEALAYVYDGETGLLTIENITSNNIKLKVIAMGHSDDGAYGIEITGVESSNPTAFFLKNIQYDYDLRVCLAPKSFTFTCTPEEAQQSVQLFKARDSLPFLTFANVAFNIYENGVQIGSQLSLLNSTAMEGIGLEIVANDGTNRLITISSMNGVNNRAIQLEPTMGIINDVDITQGNVVKYDGSFFMCLAKKPT